MQGGRASIQEKGGGAEWRRRPFYTTHLPLLQFICLYGLPPRRPRPWRARKLLRHIYPLPLPKNIAAAAGAEALCRIYSLPSLRMLRRISCQETKNAAIR